jgi:hypothetical protein
MLCWCTAFIPRQNRFRSSRWGWWWKEGRADRNANWLEPTWMHYRIIIPPHIGATQILRQTLDWLKEDKGCKQTRRVSPRLLLSVEVPALEGAPVPTTITELCCEACEICPQQRRKAVYVLSRNERNLFFLDRFLTRSGYFSRWLSA